MTTGEITPTSSTYRLRASAVLTSRTGRAAERTLRPASHHDVSHRDRGAVQRASLFPVLLALAAILLLGLLVLGPSMPWPATLGVGMLSVLVMAVAWAFTGPGPQVPRR